MTINKAIEILELHLANSTIHRGQDTFTAIQLGIEALKRIQDLRGKGYQETQVRLPGEIQ